MRCGVARTFFTYWLDIQYDKICSHLKRFLVEEGSIGLFFSRQSLNNPMGGPQPFFLCHFHHNSQPQEWEREWCERRGGKVLVGCGGGSRGAYHTFKVACFPSLFPRLDPTEVGGKTDRLAEKKVRFSPSPARKKRKSFPVAAVTFQLLSPSVLSSPPLVPSALCSKKQ